MTDCVTVEEAKEILGYKGESVALLCRQGRLEGAVKRGHQWFIPRKSVENYVKAPQGFAAIWKRRRAAEKTEIEKIYENSVISQNYSAEKDEFFDEKEDIESEILTCLKILIKEAREIRKILAQEKS